MAKIKFELKKEHISLLSHMKWSMNETDNIISEDENDEFKTSPFGGNNIYEDMSIIIDGKKNDVNIESDTLIEISEEDKIRFKSLYKELPTALNIILYTKSFEPGLYVRKWYDIDWKKKATN
jgi:hypothetical protein